MFASLFSNQPIRRSHDIAAIEIKVQDIGDFADVPVIEIHVEPGTVVQLEGFESLIAKLAVSQSARSASSKLSVQLLLFGGSLC